MMAMEQPNGMSMEASSNIFTLSLYPKVRFLTLTPLSKVRRFWRSFPRRPSSSLIRAYFPMHSRIAS